MITPRLIHRLVLLVAVTLGSAARATEAPDQPSPSDERSLAPYFFVRGGDDGVDRLPLLDTDVQVDIAGVIAHVTVKQTYKNDGTRPIHARYVFPASTRAAVHGLRLTVGDQVVRAQIREREQAQREYKAAQKAGKNAALLEQQRPNVFTMDLANLMPGQRVVVELDYSELLVPTDGEYEFVYPTVVGPRYSRSPASGAPSSETWIQSPYFRQDEPPSYSLALHGSITAGMPIRELASLSHAIHAEWSDSSRADFGLGAQEQQGGNRDFVLRYRLSGDQLQSGLLLHQGQDENFFLMMVQPPRRVAQEQVPPREYIFVVDVSGSMNGFPIETAKHLMRDLIGNLRSTDAFNVLTFAGGSELWSERSLPATQANVQAAIAMLERQQGGGGTELLAALRRAMELPRVGKSHARSLVLVTDGYISAEADVFEYVRNHLDRANVFTFGIGSSVNRHLLEGVARAGLGEPFVVSDAAQAPAAAARFRQYVQYPLLSGVHVAYEDFYAYDVTPAFLPDVLAERPILLQGKWRGSPRGRVVITGTTGTGHFERSLDVAATRPDPTNHALRELWARTTVAELADWGGETHPDGVRRKIVGLGLEYNLLTRYTSFVAVHEVVVNPSGDGVAVAQPLPLPQGVSDLAVGGVAVGDEPGLLWLAAGIFLAGALLTLRSRARLATSQG